MRTCVYMFWTNGRRSRLAVLRGKMKGNAFDTTTASLVAIHDTTRAPSSELYRELANQHATPDAPPVYWQELEPRA